jgi:hypothetical protein
MTDCIVKLSDPEINLYYKSRMFSCQRKKILLKLVQKDGILCVLLIISQNGRHHDSVGKHTGLH